MPTEPLSPNRRKFPGPRLQSTASAICLHSTTSGNAMRTFYLLAAVYVLCHCCPDLRAQDNWPQFRGPQGNGISEATGLPTTWSETQNIKWKTPIHGKGWSSPVIWGDQIWITTATEDGKENFAV